MLIHWLVREREHHRLDGSAAQSSIFVRDDGTRGFQEVSVVLRTAEGEELAIH